MKSHSTLDRRVSAFREGPASVRNAIRLIVAATVVTTFLGGLLVWIFDRHDFSNLGDAMWWSLQTVTTVGYGDVTPKNGVGRLIGAAVLLYSVAFLTILTAAITTTFIERARAERRPDEQRDVAPLLIQLDDIASRLDRIENSLTTSQNTDPPR